MTSWGVYVGRVGGLAVALGIGAAIASGQGVASADSLGRTAGFLRVPRTPAKLPGWPCGRRSLPRQRRAVPRTASVFRSRHLGPSDRQARRESLIDRIDTRRNENLSDS